MLRKTAAKAFGDGKETPAEVPLIRHQTHRGAALERLFGDLHGRLSELRQRRTQASVEPTSGQARTIEVTRPRALSQGVEFTLMGPYYCCRFLNTMNGFIRVRTFAGAREGHSESVREEVLSVHPYWGTYRPILKPLTAPLSRPGRERSRNAGRTLTCQRPPRTAFCYTSAAELAAHYLAVVCGK